MLTQCPNCDTTFRVTSEILRVAQGQVCCGRCETQFDALERLLEEDDALDEIAEEDEDDVTVEADTPDLRLSEPDLEEDEDTEVETVADEDWVELDADDTRDALVEPDVEVEIEAGQSYATAADLDDVEADTEAEAVDAETYEESTEDLEEPEEPEAEEPPAVIPNRVTRRNYAAPGRGERQTPAAQTTASRQATARELDDTDQFDLIKRPLQIPSPPIWKYLAAPLALLLVFQVFNHYRAPLARHPRLGNAVGAFYRALGVDLIPDWNLRAYEIKRLGVASDPALPGTLRVRASVRNRAAFPQPYPLVKVVLEDLYGGSVRAREFKPIEYLDKPPPPNARLAPRQQILANISIVDPGGDAAGYRFDVCLLGKNGPVCGEDLPMISP